MKMKKYILKSVFALLTLSAVVSCKDEFYDVNENPNNPSVSNPGLTLPVAQDQLVNLNATTMTIVGQYFMYNWATPSNWSANQDFTRYQITSTFQTGIFTTSYLNVFKNLTYVENFTDPAGVIDYSYYKGISSILKAYQYQHLVDTYGDVPYTEANQRQNNLTPKYDKAEDIYKDLILKMTEVVPALDNMPLTAENPGAKDIIFGGDVVKWQKFANTVKLRLLMRLTNTKQDSFIKDEIAKITANGKGFITANVSVAGATFYSDNVGKLNPFYGLFKAASTGNQTDRNDFTVATDTAIDFFTNNNDKRLARLYAPAKTGGAFKGAPQKTTLPGVGFTSNDLSKVGPGLIKTPTQDQPLMLLSEALFLQAEAVQRGFLAGNAEALYNKAVQESFTFLGVENATVEANTYLAQAIQNVNFATSTDKIEAIITQKWAALNGTSSIESWFEYNRTGFPKGLPIPAESGRTTRPYRLLIPVSEVATNSNNVPTQTPETAFNQKIFWQR